MTDFRFVPGQVYFRVVYPDSALRQPVVQSFEFRGIGRSSEDDTDAYLFQYLPGFHHEEDEGDPSRTDAFIFQPANASELLDIHGLLVELAAVRDRIARAEPP
jgi:hypothetical protein